MILLVAFSGIARAETIEFACERIEVSNPTTMLWQVDLGAARVSLVSGDEQYRWSAQALITPTSIDWQGGDQRWHLDRLSGHITMIAANGPNQTVTVEFDCHKTNGF